MFEIWSVPDIPLHPVAPGTGANPALHFAPNAVDSFKSYTIPDAMETTWKLAKTVEASETKAGIRAHFIDCLVNHKITPAWAISMRPPSYLTLSNDSIPEFIELRKCQYVESLKCIAHFL